MLNKERLKEVISELIEIEGEKLENLDSVYKCLTEIDYLIYRRRYKEEHEYIDKILYNIEKFCLESDYLKKRDIFILIKSFCNILTRYIL